MSSPVRGAVVAPDHWVVESDVTLPFVEDGPGAEVRARKRCADLAAVGAEWRLLRVVEQSAGFSDAGRDRE